MLALVQTDNTNFEATLYECVCRVNGGPLCAASAEMSYDEGDSFSLGGFGSITSPPLT